MARSAVQSCVAIDSDFRLQGSGGFRVWGDQLGVAAGSPVKASCLVAGVFDLAVDLRSQPCLLQIHVYYCMYRFEVNM